MVPRLEALADAIMEVNDWHGPDTPAYRARNPLWLRDFNQEKLRDFPRLSNGYDAAVYDLKCKCSGRTRAKLVTPDLLGLMRVYSMPDSSALRIAQFLQSALKDREISHKTKLEYFLL